MKSSPELFLYLNDDEKDMRTKVQNIEIANNVSYSDNINDIDEDRTSNNDKNFNPKIFKENGDKFENSEDVSSNFKTDRKTRESSLSSSSTDTNVTAVTEAVIKKAGSSDSMDMDMDKELQSNKNKISDRDLEMHIQVNTKEGSKEPVRDYFTDIHSSSESIHSQTPKSEITNNLPKDIEKIKFRSDTLVIENGIVSSEFESSYNSEDINVQLTESSLDLAKVISPLLHQKESFITYNEKTNDQKIDLGNFRNLPKESTDNSTSSQILNQSDMDYENSNLIAPLDKNIFVSNDKISENLESLNDEIEFISRLKYSSGTPKLVMEYNRNNIKSTAVYEVNNSANASLSKIDLSINSGSSIVHVNQDNSDSISILGNQSSGISRDLEDKYSRIHDKINSSSPRLSLESTKSYKIDPEHEQPTLNTVLDTKSKYFGGEENEKTNSLSTEDINDTTYNTAKSENAIKSSEIDHLKDSMLTHTKSKIHRRRYAEKDKVEKPKTDSEFNDMLNSLIDSTNHFSISSLIESTKISSDINNIAQKHHHGDSSTTKDNTNSGIQLTENTNFVEPTDKLNTPEHIIDNSISSPIKNSENLYSGISEEPNINSITHSEKEIEANNNVYSGISGHAVNDSERIRNLSIEPTHKANDDLEDSSNDSRYIKEPFRFVSSFESDKIYPKDIKDSVLLDNSMETIIKDIKLGLNNPNDINYISNKKSHNQNTCIGNSSSSDGFEGCSEEILHAKKSENFCEDVSTNDKNHTKSLYKRKKFHKPKVMDLPKDMLTNLRKGNEASYVSFDIKKENLLPDLLSESKTYSNVLVPKNYSDSVYFEKSPELYSIYAKYSINHIDDSILEPKDVESDSIVHNNQLLYNSENYPTIDLYNKSTITDISNGTIIPYDQSNKNYNSKRKPTVSGNHIKQKQ
ncbi:hypothetical protein AYI70_g2752 [Smittium culicis]|uniref:Uncharacterized protein n=1 Tax=Smittium culicis TaxID=133412 RepID=A0A1R1Y6Q6_9FUNG|nr:hypothetical protein AYI70_g2752 [Smittium culicis]